MSNSLNKNYWESRWQSGQTGWDLGCASPPLMDYALGIPSEKRVRLAVLLPGSGSGYEAVFLVKNGFSNVTVLDISEQALEKTKSLFQAQVADFQEKTRFVCEDFFQHDGQYDLILEQTFFCALDPSLRRAYVEKMQDLLVPGGILTGVLFDREFPGGPPFGGSREEYEALFSSLFKILKLEKCRNSAKPRAGTEVFFEMKKALPS